MGITKWWRNEIMSLGCEMVHQCEIEIGLLHEIRM